jgi:hypothetical protein
MSKRLMEHREKHHLAQKGYVEIHMQRPFLNNKVGVWKILVVEIQTVSMCFDASSTHNFFLFFEKFRLLIFGGMSKFLKLIFFG